MTAAHKRPPQTTDEPILPSTARLLPARRSKTPRQPIQVPRAKRDSAGGASITPIQPESDPHYEQFEGLIDPMLSFLAAGLDDIESARLAAGNRLSALTRPLDNHGFGMPTDDPIAKVFQAQFDQLKAVEEVATKALQKQLRKHPLYPHIKASKGLGDKQVARLLHAIHDPFWNDLHDRPRTVRELYAYCGLDVINPSEPPGAQIMNDSQESLGTRTKLSNASHRRADSHTACGGVARHKQKGQRVTWSPEARMRIRLIAESCMKQSKTAYYRQIYDEARLKYANSTHNQPCPQCGPKGSPALTNSPLSLGHQHARALRLVSKDILKDLWLAARAIYDANSTIEGFEFDEN